MIQQSFYHILIILTKLIHVFIQNPHFLDDSNLQTIGKCAFSYSAISKIIIIPSSVTIIGKRAFCNCNKLQHIIIPNDSKLQTIESGAFSNSKIESFTIPSELIELKEGWCFGTSYLKKIKVSPNNL